MSQSFGSIKCFTIALMMAALFSVDISAENDSLEAQNAQVKQALSLVPESNFQGRRREFFHAQYAALIPLANKGNYIADTFIGKELYQYSFRPNWYEEALAHLGKAAAQNVPEAMAYLGHLLLRGSSTAQPNKQKAEEWYQKAVDTGQPAAILLVAQKYAEGAVGLREVQKSYEIAQKAADRGYGPAIKFLITNYHYGILRKLSDPITGKVIYDSGGEIKKIIEDVKSGASREDPIVNPHRPPQAGEAYVGKNHEKMYATIQKAIESRDPAIHLFMGKFLLEHADDPGMTRNGVALLQSLANAKIYQAAYIVGKFFHKGITYRSTVLMPASDKKAIEILTPAHDAGHMRSTGYLYTMALQRGDFANAAELKDAFMASDPSLNAAKYLFTQTLNSGHVPSIEDHLDEILDNFQNTGFIALGHIFADRKTHSMTRSETENIVNTVLQSRLPSNVQPDSKLAQALNEIGEGLRSDRSAWDRDCTVMAKRMKSHQADRTKFRIFSIDYNIDLERCD